MPPIYKEVGSTSQTGKGKEAMKQLWISGVLLAGLCAACNAQSLEDLNIEMHGYATQGFVYTSQNNWNTLSSTSGSSAWTDVVLNVTAQPTPKLRIGAQGRYFLLGDFGNEITLDWASGDYKVNDRFGVRFGKVKTPMNLFNELQDIDPALMWSMLPQSVYPLASRNTLLAHEGGVAYGSLDGGKNFGSVNYRAWAGERIVSASDGFFKPLRDLGATVPNGVSGSTFGGALFWNTPITGLTLGASDSSTNFSNASITDTQSTGPGGSSVTVNGVMHIPSFQLPIFYGKYERKRMMLAAEHVRAPLNISLSAPSNGQLILVNKDERGWYGMGTWRFSDKLTAGTYYSSLFDRKAVLGPSRYEKDWALSARYYFNPFLYAKAEQHFIDGTHVGFSSSDNLSGLRETTRMTTLKVGVSF